jgi:prepilin-type processing-associated H-X9-DG protein
MLAEAQSINFVGYNGAPASESAIYGCGRVVASPATDTTGDEFDSLIYRHNANFSQMNLLYFDGHIDTVDYRSPEISFASLGNGVVWDH